MERFLEILRRFLIVSVWIIFGGLGYVLFSDSRNEKDLLIGGLVVPGYVGTIGVVVVGSLVCTFIIDWILKKDNK